MATDDRLKQYSEVGEEFLEAARSRAVEFLKEMSRLGQSTQKQASGQVDELVDAGKKGTDAVLDAIRAEIASQLGALGLATKADLVALEARLAAAKVAVPAAKAPAAKKAAVVKATPQPVAKKAPAKKAPAKKAATTKAAGPVKSATTPV